MLPYRGFLGGRVAQLLNCRTYRNFGPPSFAHVAKGGYRTANSEWSGSKASREPVRAHTVGSIVLALAQTQGGAHTFGTGPPAEFAFPSHYLGHFCALDVHSKLTQGA